MRFDEQAALAERARMRRAEEAEEARKAAQLAAERMRLRKQNLLRLEDPQGQYSAAVQYLNRERFRGKPEPPPADDNALVVLARSRGHQGVVQYHVRYKGHVQWFSVTALSDAARQEGGVNKSMQVLTLAKETLMQIEVRLGEADLAAEGADISLAEANEQLQALAGMRDLGEVGRQLAVAQQAAADRRDRMHAAAIATALEMREQQANVDDAEAAVKAAKAVAAELLLRWQREGERKEREQRDREGNERARAEAENSG